MVCREDFQFKKLSMELKCTNSSVIKTFRVQWPVKKVVLTVFGEMKGPVTIDFLEKVQM